MKAKQIDITNKEIKDITLDKDVFGVDPNFDLMAQYVYVHGQRGRLGTKKTKGRGEVRGGGRKPWRQKGTGRARVGSIRSPLWVGGGHTHEISPVLNRRVRMTKKMRKAALCSAVSLLHEKNLIVFLNEIKIEKPNTQEVVKILKKLDIAENKVLFVTPEKNSNLEKSTRNLSKVSVREVRLLNAYDVLNHKMVVFVGDSVKTV